MGVFDLFSGSKAAEPHYAAAAGRAAGLNQATGTLQGGYADAAKYLENIPGYLDTAKGYLESAKQPLSDASARFDPLAATAGQGFQGYANLFGIGGGDPTAAVRAQPGYQFSQSEGAEQAKRNAASMGMLSSGNAMQSVFDRGANIADTKWQQYAEGLKPFLSLAPQIAGQQGTYNVAQSGLEAQKGGYEAGKANYAGLQSGLETELAKTLAQYQTGTANQNAQGMIDAQQARGAASKNVFDAVKTGVELAGKVATGGMFPSFGSGGGGNPNIPSGGYSASGMPWGSFNV